MNNDIGYDSFLKGFFSIETKASSKVTDVIIGEMPGNVHWRFGVGFSAN